MNLLVTLNSNYIYPLCVMLHSLSLTNIENKFDIYVAYSSLSENDFSQMKKALGNLDATIHRVQIENKIFENAPVLDRISKETYYRLLIDKILPETVDRVLYIDPDVVIANDISPLYNINMQGNIVAGASHMTPLVCRYNQLRLDLKRSNQYINAGILLIDVKAWRKFTDTDKILDFITKNYKKLYLSDQDVINSMFEDKTLYIDATKYNLDEKTFLLNSSRFHTKKVIDLDWVRKNSIVIHFNGKHKPWKEEYYSGKLKDFFEKFKDF